MPITSPYVFTAGDDATSTRLNTRSTAIVELQTPPRARVSNSAAQSIANATPTALSFDTEQTDTDGIHSTSVNTSRMTIVTAGRYKCTGQVTFASNATGSRGAIIRENGAAQRAATRVQAANGALTVIQVSDEVLLSVGDYVELVVDQASGGALNANSGSGASFLHVVWVSLT